MIGFDFDLKSNSTMRREFIEYCASLGIYATIDEREIPPKEPDMPRNIPWDVVFSFMFKKITDCCEAIEKLKIATSECEIVLSVDEKGTPILEEYHASAGFNIGGKARFALVRIEEAE
jgi:hypothetical protein